MHRTQPIGPSAAVGVIGVARAVPTAHVDADRRRRAGSAVLSAVVARETLGRCYASGRIAPASLPTGALRNHSHRRWSPHALLSSAGGRQTRPDARRTAARVPHLIPAIPGNTGDLLAVRPQIPGDSATGCAVPSRAVGRPDSAQLSTGLESGRQTGHLLAPRTTLHQVQTGGKSPTPACPGRNATGGRDDRQNEAKIE